MKFGIGCFALAIAVANLRPSALAFTLSNASLRPCMTPVPPRQMLSMAQARQSTSSATKAATEQFAVDAPASSETRPRRLERALIGASAVAMSSIVGAAGAIAEYVDPDDVGEVVTSDLPPMWVPLAVGVVLTVGISLLQGSLGDVMNDEAKLGGLSGARAAKQSARDRNMFKKKQ